MKRAGNVICLFIMVLWVLLLWGCHSSDEPVVDPGVFYSFYKVTGELVINEIVARDFQGGSDWVELYVTGDEPVNLGDYALVDDNAEHSAASLPDIMADPGEYILIYATAEDPGEGIIYVPFGLGSDDSVTLLYYGQTADILDWDGGEAPLGYSYGRLPDGSGDARGLTPTPGESNAALSASPLVINEVVANEAGDGSDWIELFVAGDEAVSLSAYALVDDNADHEPVALPDINLDSGDYIIIYAAVEDPGDGSCYVPFGLGSTDSLSLVYNEGVVNALAWQASDVTSGVSYGLLPDGSGGPQVLTPTPAAPNQAFELFDAGEVGEVRLELDPLLWQDILDNPEAEEYQPGNIVFNGIRAENVAIRTKGNSSLRACAMDPDCIRYSLKVDMNYYEGGRHLAGLQKINLNNSHRDPTLMREPLSYDLTRYLGLPTPRTAFVNLYINDELMGLYLAVEQIDDEFVEANFASGDGDLYKAQNGPGVDLVWRGNNMFFYSGIELKTNEIASDNSAFLAMLKALNRGSNLETVLDVEAVLKYFAVSTLLTNLDSYLGPPAHNYYLYEEAGIFSVIPWDFNESFGTFNMGQCSSDQLIELMIDEPTSGAMSDRPLIARLLQQPDYPEIYHEYLFELIDGPFDPEAMEQTIDETADLIREHVAADPTRFFSMAEFEQALSSDSGTTFGLKRFVNDRVESVIEQLAGLAPASGDGSGNCPGSGFPPGPPPGM